MLHTKAYKSCEAVNYNGFSNVGLKEALTAAINKAGKPNISDLARENTTELDKRNTK